MKMKEFIKQMGSDYKSIKCIYNFNLKRNIKNDPLAKTYCFFGISFQINSMCNIEYLIIRNNNDKKIRRLSSFDGITLEEILVAIQEYKKTDDIDKLIKELNLEESI